MGAGDGYQNRADIQPYFPSVLLSFKHHNSGTSSIGDCFYVFNKPSLVFLYVNLSHLPLATFSPVAPCSQEL